MNVPKQGFVFRNRHGVHRVRKESDGCFWLYLYRYQSGWNALRRLTNQQVKQFARRQLPDHQAEFYFQKGEEV